MRGVVGRRTRAREWPGKIMGLHVHVRWWRRRSGGRGGGVRRGGGVKTTIGGTHTHAHIVNDDQYDVECIDDE